MRERNREQRFIFVGGCERSGTSLVQKILVSHSRIAGGPELVFTGRIVDLYGRMAASYPDSYASRLEAFYDDEELAEAFRSLYASLFRQLSNRKPGALYFSEKTPSNIFAAKQLLDLFPDALFVDVTRDGRDVLASHRDVRERFEKAGTERYNRGAFRPWRVSERWNLAVERHLELAADRGLEGRIFTVRYEQLVREPEKQLRGLFDFLGLELESRSLAPETITAEDTGVPIDGFWMTEEMYRRGFETGRIGRWRDLPFGSRILGGLMMAANLRLLGYETSGSQVWAARVLGWAARRLHLRSR